MICPSTTNEPPKLPAYTISMEPKRKTNRLNDPFCTVQVALGRRIHPVSSHANLPDDRAEFIETMCGYLRGADCSRKLVVTVRVLVCVWGPVIDLQTTRGPVIITPVPTGRDTLKTCWMQTNCQMHLYTSTHTHTDTRNHIQTHSCLSELNAGQCPTVIQTRLLWRHRHHTNTRMISHTYALRHMCTHTFASRQIVYFHCIVCLFTWYTDLSDKSARCC